MKAKHVATAFGCVLGLLLSAPASAERRTMVIGSGEVTGFYYPTAGALCRVINKEHPHDANCAVAPSSGSAANLAALKSGETDFAIVQSRAAVQAAQGADAFRDSGPMPELRAVMSLHGEAVAVVARQGAGIDSVADLKGKRVNLGRPGSFQRTMAELVLEAAGLSEGDLAPAVELDLVEEAQALCEGNIDAAFFTGIHPMPEVVATVEECNATLVPIKGKSIEPWLKRNPWMSKAALRHGLYDGVKEDVPSLQLKAVLTTTTKMTDDEVRDVLKAIHVNFPAFTRLHPVLKGLNKGDSAHEGIAIPLHDGARAFYEETGLAK
ncbi:TAXI family TRAP transporter solute-binding subunit [Magnetospirillum aberrantis]|uniref:TAXI family TRAP transporter solute-binding subunit n=1 Tax=Magnetospirillum aberrantis SpK TaxID=908842 RepID=A0A7C9UTZ3_9PROT|nr:TAXI family TRAP transporter solute-binding subunit [Magnetospirillum aberrantis SpK]